VAVKPDPMALGSLAEFPRSGVASSVLFLLGDEEKRERFLKSSKSRLFLLCCSCWTTRISAGGDGDGVAQNGKRAASFIFQEWSAAAVTRWWG
jgi:hypothetical protein